MREHGVLFLLPFALTSLFLHAATMAAALTAQLY